MKKSRHIAPLMARVQPVATSDDRRAIGSLLAAMEPFFKIRGTMPAQYIKAFLLVAFEGLSLSAYAERAGTSLSVMSRHLQDIGDRNRYKEEGFGLVTSRQNPMELDTRVHAHPQGAGVASRDHAQLGAELI